MITKLLNKDKSKRLGVKGGDEVLGHPFFAELDIDKLMQKQLKAPFLPKITDPEGMRRHSQKVVRLKHLEETVIPS